MPKTSVTVTIPAGQSVSNAADLTSGSVATILGPTDWTPANLSFQISADNAAFFDLHDDQGQEIRKAIAPNSAVTVDTTFTQAAMWVRLRSGPRINPVAQAADRIFTLILI